MWMYCSGNATQLRKYADDLDDMMEANRQVFLERAKIEESELIELMENETYLTPEKALEYGLIDEIMGKTAEPVNTEEILEKLSDMQKTVKQSAYKLPAAYLGCRNHRKTRNQEKTMY